MIVHPLFFDIVSEEDEIVFDHLAKFTALLGQMRARRAQTYPDCVASLVYSPQSTLYSLQCTAYSLQSTVSPQSTLYSLQCTAYSLQSIVYSLQSTVASLVYSPLSTLYSLQCTVYSLQMAVHSLQSTADLQSTRRCPMPTVCIP